jgi:hypothetical protein
LRRVIPFRIVNEHYDRGAEAGNSIAGEYRPRFKVNFEGLEERAQENFDEPGR